MRTAFHGSYVLVVQVVVCASLNSACMHVNKLLFHEARFDDGQKTNKILGKKGHNCRQ